MNKTLLGGLMAALTLIITFSVAPTNAATTWDTTGVEE